MADPDDAVLARQREDIAAALKRGLATDWQARAYEDADVRRVVAALQALPADALERKLRTAGFTLEPYAHPDAPEIEQACRTCMYYESHRRYCNLPELKLGVEPEWSCILWRI
ncbi:MAG: hypothetical protein ACOY5V_17245 [Pseudomonadota bacterium]|jgi:hypothetical protein